MESMETIRFEAPIESAGKPKLAINIRNFDSELMISVKSSRGDRERAWPSFSRLIW